MLTLCEKLVQLFDMQEIEPEREGLAHKHAGRETLPGRSTHDAGLPHRFTACGGYDHFAGDPAWHRPSQ
ncbi:MAG: hypothetical protein JWO91_3091, partial [Acidobacteriaceae bacterium]|nr:hypothetical protein [Acidobacteriaceae bacterium]